MEFQEAGWIAGIIDGEGTITLTVDGSRELRSPVVSVCSTTPEIVRRCKDLAGGQITCKRSRDAIRSEAWTWKVRRGLALSVLKECLPFMTEPEKIRRATMLLGHWQALTPRNGKYTESMLELKRRFEAEFFLNSRSPRCPKI